MNTNRHEQAPLTSRQRQVLQFVASFIGDNGYPPSQREICKFLCVPGNRPAVKHLIALEQKGYLKRDPVSRGIVLTTPISRSVSLPIAGTVRAGHLTPVVEDIRGYFSVDHLAVKGEGCFFLAVSGDSMIEAGIVEGDLALVRPQVTADNGDTVVAMVNGEATLKKIFRDADHIRLQPANATMQPIIIRPEAGDVAIIGKVIGVYRRLE